MTMRTLRLRGPHKRLLRISLVYNLTCNLILRKSAARGIVALQPAIPELALEDIRSISLARALCKSSPELYTLLRRMLIYTQASEKYAGEISSELSSGLKLPKIAQSVILDILTKGHPAGPILASIQAGLDDLASQGVYLTDEQGNVKAHSTPAGLPPDLRIAGKFSTRPYFRQARSFRAKFVSDVTKSIFNKRGTFFLCVPILDRDRLEGVLFSACQVGQWMKPIMLASPFWDEKIAFILVNSNGVCLLPPNKEFNSEDYDEIKGAHASLPNANLWVPL